MAALPVLSEAGDAALRRPRTRGECMGAPRPCRWAMTCRYGLPRGNCALDAADAGERTFDEIARLLGVSRERPRQIFFSALKKLRGSPDAAALLDKLLE